MTEPRPEIALSSGAGGASVDSESARESICAATRRVCVKTFGETMQALLITGSMGRREASFVFKNGQYRCLGDAEFMVVFRTGRPLPSNTNLEQVRELIENELTGRGISCSIDLSAIQKSYLESLPPHVFSYELKHGSEVLWGDQKIVDSIPDFSVSELSKEDAWRLLCNRLLELFECTNELAKHPTVPSDQLEYKITKLYLDTATSLLIFLGSYAPSYRDRREQLVQLASYSSKEVVLGCNLRELAYQVSAFTDRKLGISVSASEPPSINYKEAIHQARNLWRSELANLTGKPETFSDAQLLGAWAKSRPFSEKARGWLYVVRAQGWLKSIGQWPRWLKMFWKGSPRYWIYSASCSLLFALTEESFNTPPTVAPKLLAALPARQNPAGTPGSWQEFAKDILWNYKRFLTGTRA